MTLQVFSKKAVKAILPYGIVVLRDKWKKLETYMNDAWKYVPPVAINVQDSMEKQIIRISFEISNICNYSGIHKKCPTSCYKEKKLLDDYILYKTVDELSKYNFKGSMVFHRYNEPLLHKEKVLAFIAYINRLLPDVKIAIYTNGSFLFQEDLNRFEQYKIDHITVSSYSKEEHYRLIKLTTRIPYKVFYSVLDDRKNIYTEKPYDLYLPCYATIRDLTVNCHGQISLCCFDWDNKAVFGDLHTQSLKEILNSPQFMKVHNELIQGKRTLEICRRCRWQR
jgi:8-amino-3,8-dideoxy-alpha-D-manno-octulosonate transaminase